MTGLQPRAAFAGLAALILVGAHRSSEDEGLLLGSSRGNTSELDLLIEARDLEIEELERKLAKARLRRHNSQAGSSATPRRPAEQKGLRHRGPRMAAEAMEAGSTDELQEQETRGMVAQEDLSADGLLEALELHEDSEFWQATVDAMADQLTAGRTATSSSFTELGATERAAFAQEHRLVQRAVARVRGAHANEGGWFRGRKDLVTCAEDVSALGDQVGKGRTQEEAVLAAQQELLPVRMSSTGQLQNLEEEESPVQAALRDAWAMVKRDFKDLASFFTNFLRWEVAVNIVGAPASFGIPLIGWKCQPLMMCLKEIVLLPLKFLKLMATIIWGLAKVILGLLKGLVRWLGIAAGAKSTAPSTVGADVNVPVQAPAGSNGELPSKDQVLEMVTAVHSQLFDEYQLYRGKCAGCGARLKGFFDIAPLEILKTVATGGLLGVIKIAVSTIPAPMAKYVGCTSCLWKWREDLNYLLKGSSSGDTKRYWAAGQCNAHTMGMCVMLEKVRMCGHRVHWTTSTIDENAGDTQVTKNQKKFCDAFRGINLRLTKIGGHVRCPAVVRDRVFQSENKLLAFNEGDMTDVSFHDGCHMVRETLKAYNSRCMEEPETGFFASFYQDYNPEPDVTNASSVAQKCRALFGCSEQQTTATLAGSNWDDLESTLRGIISQVDDFRSRPRSSSPQEASEKIVQLLDTTTSNVGKFEGLTSQRLAAVRGYTPVSWGEQLEDVFLSELWDDRCFRGLHPLVDLWADNPPGSPPKPAAKPSNRISALYALHGKPGMLGKPLEAENFRFFQRFATAMAVTDTSAVLQCEVKKQVMIMRAHRTLELGPPQEGPVMSFVVNIELHEWQVGWKRQQLVLHPLGLPRDQYVKLLTSSDANGWYLGSCSGIACADNVGYRIKKILLKGVRGPMVYEFRDTSNAMANLLYAMDEQFAKYGGGPNVGLQTTGLMDFVRLQNELSSWWKGFTPYVIQKQNESYFEHLVSSGRHLAVKEIVEASKRLTQFFARKGWTFAPVHTGKTGFASEVLHMHGSPVMARWQLQRMILLVTHPNWDAIVHLRNAIREHAYDMLAHAISKEWTISNGFWTPRNPFKGFLEMDPVFEVCDQAPKPSAVDYDSDDGIPSVAPCSREGIARVELHFMQQVH